MILVVVLFQSGLIDFDIGQSPASDEQPTDRSSTSEGIRDEARLLDAWAAGRSGVMCTVAGEVVKVLPDDDEGSRHQRFIIRLSGHEHTLLVAHNIDLAEPVAIEEGDTLLIRGQYEYNDQGGLLHWTHHDPGGRREGGWIELDGVRTE